LVSNDAGTHPPAAQRSTQVGDGDFTVPDLREFDPGQRHWVSTPSFQIGRKHVEVYLDSAEDESA
jgi:hypothetical protein